MYGLGSVGGIRNAARSRTMADNRARAEVARVFELYTASLMKSYVAERGPLEQQQVDMCMMIFSAMTLGKVQIVNHWVNPVDGKWYALGQLDLRYLLDTLPQMRDLDAEVKLWVRQNAVGVYERLRGR